MTRLLAFLSLLTLSKGQIKIDLGAGGDGLGGLGDLLSGLSGAAKQKKDGTCPSHCEELHPHHGDVYPAPKARIRPYSNGCSVPDSLRAGLGDYSAFEPCCDLHDSCYMACGIPRTFCEREFGKCMKQQCQKKYKNKASELQECISKADLFLTGTSLFGCGGYMELQRDGCDCLSHDEAAKRINEYAREFYAVYNQTHPLPKKVVDAFLDHDNDVHPKKRTERHGMLLYKLFKKYPHAIDVIARDGKSGRPGPVQFEVPQKNPEL